VTPEKVQPQSDAPTGFDWSIDPASPVASTLQCWRERDRLLWIEAESFGMLDGWITDTHFVTGWSGTGYLADSPDSRFARTTIDIPQPGDYRVWVRSLRRKADDFPAFLSIAREPSLPFGESDLGELNVWRWQQVADLRLEAGSMPIQLTRPFKARSSNSWRCSSMRWRYRPIPISIRRATSAGSSHSLKKRQRLRGQADSRRGSSRGAIAVRSPSTMAVVWSTRRATSASRPTRLNSR
jgi:hypothetical protein